MIKAAIAALAAIGALAVIAQPTPLFTGTWMVVQRQLDDGSDYKAFFQLRQEGDRITGRVLYPWGIVQIRAGSVRGSKCRFVQHLWEGLEFQNEGEIVNGKLNLRGTDWDDKWHDWDARPVPDAEAEPPARIPLPELHAVPDNGLARTPPMGWNSWNRFGPTVTGRLIREMSDAIVSSGMRDAGYTYVNIDDAWEGQRDANGVLQPNKKFGDMKKLADYAHSKGLKLGIYSSPGANTCGGYQGSYRHEQQDANTWAAWGIDYLKYDTCGAGKIYRDEEMRGVYQIMGDALVKVGRPIVFSVSSDEKAYLWSRNAGANLWRTTGDINDHWKTISEIGFAQGELAQYAGPGHWNDPDMLEVGNGGMTTEDYRTHMSLWCLLAAPLIAGNDIRNMSADTKEILLNREVIAIDQDPLGKQGTPVWKEGLKEIWTKPLSGGAVAVGLFNRGEAAATITASWIHSARDLWAHKQVQAGDGGFTVEVPRHGVVLLRVDHQ